MVLIFTQIPMVSMVWTQSATRYVVGSKESITTRVNSPFGCLLEINLITATVRQTHPNYGWDNLLSQEFSRKGAK